MTKEKIKKNYTIKILFGPMFGCELHLPADDYFLIINAGLTLQNNTNEQGVAYEHAAQYTTNTLYIPCSTASPNITLHLPDYSINDKQTCCNIEVHDENGNHYKSSLKENDIFIHEHIRLAIKCSDDVWSDDIKNYHSRLTSAERNSISIIKMIKKKNVLVTVFAVLLFLMALSFFVYHKMSTNHQVIALSEVMSGAPSPLEIVKGREDKNIYILAQKFREMEWAKEAIHKLKDKNNLIPVLLSKSQKDIIDELSNIGYPVLQVDYSSPKHLIFAVYRDLTTSEEMSLKNLILKKTPYALDVSFIIKTKPQLIKEARQGLDRLNIFYRQIVTTNGYSLVIKDSLSDNSLNALRDFINKYNHQWGNTVITFSINLDENWLQNKSYVDSSKGYLFLNPRHWYFPISNKEF